MKVIGLTDIGLIREENQDSFATVTFDRSSTEVAVVCDGMGGANGGRIASSQAVHCYLDFLEDELSDSPDTRELKLASDRSARSANYHLREQSASNPSLAGMGTTLVALLHHKDSYVVSNVGDSRAYLYDGLRLTQITKDHSYVQTLVDLGKITKEEARVHPEKSYITRALGSDKGIDCDHFAIYPKEGDYILLCSDGLVDALSDVEILDVLHTTSFEQIPPVLIDCVKQRGARDNVTVVLARIEGGSEHE